MSDQTIAQPCASLKTLNARIQRFSHKVDELDILVHRYKCMSYEHNQLDVLAFEIRQEFEYIREVIKNLQMINRKI